MRLTGGGAKGRKLRAVPKSGVRPTAARVRAAIFNIVGQDLSGIRVLDLFAGVGTIGIEALSRGAAHAVFVERSERTLKTLRANLAAAGFVDRATIVGESLGACREIARGERGETEARLARAEKANASVGFALRFRRAPHFARAKKPLASRPIAPEIVVLDVRRGGAFRARQAQREDRRAQQSVFPDRLLGRSPFLGVVAEPYDLIIADPPYKDAADVGYVIALLEANLATPRARFVIEHGVRVLPPETIGPLGLLFRRRYGDTVVSIYGKSERNTRGD